MSDTRRMLDELAADAPERGVTECLMQFLDQAAEACFWQGGTLKKLTADVGFDVSVPPEDVRLGDLLRIANALSLTLNVTLTDADPQ